ncbi:hypothetical protein HKX48_001154 [Thoreauomyces humboldtii]|nr:hypothetical protein HKX48_001154 [Thoreauomyces humboldtii]
MSRLALSTSVCRRARAAAHLARPAYTTAIPSNHPLPSSRTVRCLHSGGATPKATADHLARFPKIAKARFAKTGWSVAAAGFGAYRVQHGMKQHAEALSHALSSGINLIDTSAHFEGGLSERLIGSVLNDKIGSGELKREALVVVTKVGYIMSPSSAPPQSRPTFEHAAIADRISHSLAPSFLESEITGSLSRLGLDKVDVLMLNNPERMVLGKHKRFELQHVYDLIGTACLHLDEEVARGRIASYGICSNSMANRSASDHVSLPQVVASVAQAGADVDNLVAVQYPFNLFEHDAYERWFDGSESLMETAETARLFQMTHRPLMAIAGGLIRVLSTTLGVHAEDERAIVEKLTGCFETVTRLEAVLPELLGGSPEETALVAKFVWGRVLSDNFTRLSQNMFAAKHYLERQVMPGLERDLALLRKGVRGEYGEADVNAWATQYETEYRKMQETFLALSAVSLLRTNQDMAQILSATSPSSLPPTDTLSSMAVRIARSALAADGAEADDVAAPGCVLVGMRRRDYVDDVVGALEGKKVDPEDLDRIFESRVLT